MTFKMNHYDTLGVAQDAAPAQIKAAYRKLASKSHPDRALNEEDRQKREAAMKRINAAYATLGDAKKRARYDASSGKRQSASGGDPRTRKKRAKAAPKAPPKDQHFDFNKIRNEHLCASCNGGGSIMMAFGMRNQRVPCYACYSSGINLLFANLYSTV